MKARPTRKLTLHQRAVRRLKRLETRRVKAMPLFVATGIAHQFAPLPSIEAIKQDICRRQQDVIRRVLINSHRYLGRAHHYRTLVAAHVSPTRLRQLVARRRIYPPTPEYTAYFWRKAYQDVEALP